MGLSLQGKGGAGNFRKTHLRDVASGHAQGVQCFGGIEVQHIPKIVIFKVFGRIKAAAHRQHIPDAVLQGSTVYYLQIQLVQFLQKTALCEIFQFCQIIRHIVLYRVLGRREKRRAQIVLLLQFSEAVFHCLDDVRRVFRAHRPQWDRTGKPACMGIGNIKVILQPLFSALSVVKYRDTVCAPVHPASELLIPSLDFQDGGSVRALGVNEQLFIKGQPIVAASRGKKMLPLCRSCDLPLCFMVQFRQGFISYRHPAHLLYSLFFLYGCKSA